MKNNIIKRKYLFAHLAAAKVYAELSHCNRRKVGAVLVKDDRIISIGYNGMPAGEPNACEIEDGSTNPRVVHAEINALRKLIRSTESAEDSIMFVTDAPCLNCAVSIFESGVAAVFFEKPYKDTAGIDYLLDKRVRVFSLDSVNLILREYDPFLKIPHGMPLNAQDIYL